MRTPGREGGLAVASGRVRATEAAPRHRDARAFALRHAGTAARAPRAHRAYAPRAHRAYAPRAHRAYAPRAHQPHACDAAAPFAGPMAARRVTHLCRTRWHHLVFRCDRR